MNRKMTRLARGAKCAAFARQRVRGRRLLVQQAGQRERAEAAGHVLQHAAARRADGTA